MSTQAQQSAATNRHAVPDALVDLSLVDAKQIAAAACISLTTWHELVRTGEAPAPAIRAQRFTRWRLVDVRAWLEQYVARRMCATAAKGEHPVVQKARKARAVGLAKQRAAKQAQAGA